jgi:hypothetical protein
MLSAFARDRAGAGNSTIVLVLAIIAAVSLLLQIQSGYIRLDPFFTSAPKETTKTAKKGKSPELFAPKPEIPAADIDRFLERRTSTLDELHNIQYETRQAIALMEPESAANLLDELEPVEAVSILRHLNERDLARILEAAPVQASAEWVKLLIKPAVLPEIPDALKDRAAQLGLYDDTAELLQRLSPPADTSEARSGQDGTQTNAESGSPSETAASEEEAAQDGNSGLTNENTTEGAAIAYSGIAAEEGVAAVREVGCSNPPGIAIA